MNTTQTIAPAASRFAASLEGVEATITDREGRVTTVNLSIGSEHVGQAQWALTARGTFRFEGGHTVYRGSVYHWSSIKDMGFGAAMASAERGMH